MTHANNDARQDATNRDPIGRLVCSGLPKPRWHILQPVNSNNRFLVWGQYNIIMHWVWPLKRIRGMYKAKYPRPESRVLQKEASPKKLIFHRTRPDKPHLWDIRRGRRTKVKKQSCRGEKVVVNATSDAFHLYRFGQKLLVKIGFKKRAGHPIGVRKRLAWYILPKN